MGASLLGNILAGKGAAKSKSQGWRVNRAGEGIVRAAYGDKKGQKVTTKGHKNKRNF